MESLSTWRHGVEPNRVAFESLAAGGSALDAVELGARSCEADETCMSVGRGGIPDELGVVTLDASIMDGDGNCGAVAFVRQYLHPISIARRVMETTPHVMLTGAGAERFAEEQGFAREELLTESSRRLYDKWKSIPGKLHARLRRATDGANEYVFVVEEDGTERVIEADHQSHDTVGILARDRTGRLAGACTTSGLAFKKHGRVGDSPIIGAGLYVDGDVGAAVATGHGELVMRAVSAFHIVEQLRQGIEPVVALTTAVERIRKDKHLTTDMQVGLLVLRADGVWCAASVRDGFEFTVATALQANSLYSCSRTGRYLPASAPAFSRNRA